MHFLKVISQHHIQKKRIQIANSRTHQSKMNEKMFSQSLENIKMMDILSEHPVNINISQICNQQTQ